MLQITKTTRLDKKINCLKIAIMALLIYYNRLMRQLLRTLHPQRHVCRHRLLFRGENV